MPSRPCNIVLLPSTELGVRAIAASESLRSDQTLFTLADGAFYPHISLYMLELKTEADDQVHELLQAIARQHMPYDLEARQYYQTMGFLDAEYAVTTALSRLQDSVVDALNPVRNGMREKDKQRMLIAEGIKREYFERFGYPNVRELFRPHITLTRFNHEEQFDTSILPDITTFNGIFDRIGFFESGDNGTCVRLVVEYALTPA